MYSESNNKKIKICHYGLDGFGHQLEGILRLVSLALNNKADYVYDFRSSYSFDHSNFDSTTLNKYIQAALNFLSYENTCKDVDTPKTLLEDSVKKYDYNTVYDETRTFETILLNDTDYVNNIYFYDGVGFGHSLPPNFEFSSEIEKSLPTMRKAFVENNPFLPTQTYDNKSKNIVCHIRLGDATNTRVLDTCAFYEIIKYFQKDENSKITIHSDGNVDHLKNENTNILGKDTDVLQVFSDFIHADILIMNYSSLSIAAHLLAKDSQQVIIPNKAGVTFQHRVLKKCTKICDIIKESVLANKTFSWENDFITFLPNNEMIAFGKSNYYQTDNFTFQSFFGGRNHTILFNRDYTEFISTRNDDNNIVRGKLIYN